MKARIAVESKEGLGVDFFEDFGMLLFLIFSKFWCVQR
jgi:hypothetical protein